jgi:hypothetical protein
MFSSLFHEFYCKMGNMNSVLDRRRILGGLAAVVAAPAVAGRAETLHLMDMGAVGDGKADDTAAIQRAIDRAADMAERRSLAIELHAEGGAYAISTLRLRSNVFLSGGAGGREGAAVARLIAANVQAGRFMIEAAGPIENWGLIGVSLTGRPDEPFGGIDLPMASAGVLSWVAADRFGLEACILGGGNNWVEHCGMQGLFRADPDGPRRGSFTLSGGDHQILHSEFAGPSQTHVSGPKLNAAGCLIEMADGLVEGVVFETGDIGLVSRGLRVRYIGCRFDTNAGIGTLLERGYENTFDACHWGRNSFADSGVYDDIHAPAGGSTGNTFIAPLFSKYGDQVSRYRIDDRITGAGWGNRYIKAHGSPGRLGFANVTGSSKVEVVP